MKITARSLSAAAFLAAAVWGSTNVYAQLAAFPGAVGYGAATTGGRTGSVYVVTNLNDSGAGSFRDAVSHSNRIVVFAVGGYINLLTAVSVSSNITILGQTAPGDGIGFMGREVSLSNKTNDIVQYVRFRQGRLDTDSGKSSVNLGTTTNMILDHISVDFGQFDNVDAVGAVNFTLSNSLIGDPTGQQFDAHVETGPVTMVNNIMSSAHNRSPLVKTNTQFINNVVYNFQAGYTVANTGGKFTQDIINNYFITGPSTTSPSDAFFQMDSNISVYASGNLLDKNNDGILNGSAVSPGSVVVLSSPGLPTTASIPTLPTAQAYAYDVANAGDSLVRDQVDAQVIADVTSLGTSGHLWSNQTATGLSNSGYGVINGGPAPVSSANDDIPDAWAITHGLNPTDPAGATKHNPLGYDMIEQYAYQLTDTMADQTWTSHGGEWTTNSANWSAAIPGVYDQALIRGTGTANGNLTITRAGAMCFSLSIGGNGPSTGESVVVNGGALDVQDTITVGDQNNGTLTLLSGVVQAANVQLGNTVFDANGAGTTYTGTLNLNGGILQAQQVVLGGGTPGSWTTGGIWNWSGGTLQAIGTLSVNASATLGANGAILDTNGNVATISGAMSGSGSFTKVGVGALTLSATDKYTGPTTLNAGTLTVTGSLAKNDSSSVFIAADATGATQFIRTSRSGASYAGFGSTVTSGLQSSADLVAGANATNNSAGESVTMHWRLRQSNELPTAQRGGGEISEVFVLSGMANAGTTGTGQTDPFALQMAYTTNYFAPSGPATETAAAAGGLIHLSWLNASNQWTNAVAGNFLAGASGDVFTDVQGSWSNFAATEGITNANIGSFLGSWGVDAADNQVWAVLDHNSTFSVRFDAVVPEPSLAILSLMGCSLLLWKRNRRVVEPAKSHRVE